MILKKGMEKMLMVTQTVVFLTTSLTVGVNLNLVKELQFFFFNLIFSVKYSQLCPMAL